MIAIAISRPAQWRVEVGEVCGPSHNWGSVDGRQLSFNLHVPWRMKSYDREWSWRKAANPLNWWRTVRDKYEWAFWWTFQRGSNHRCYCREGVLFDGRMVVAGFGLNWWYQNYTGPVPCVCDEVIAELFPSEDTP